MRRNVRFINYRIMLEVPTCFCVIFNMNEVLWAISKRMHVTLWFIISDHEASSLKMRLLADLRSTYRRVFAWVLSIERALVEMWLL